MGDVTTLTIDCGGGGIKGSVLDAGGNMRAQPLRVRTPYPLPLILTFATPAPPCGALLVAGGADSVGAA